MYEAYFICLNIKTLHICTYLKRVNTFVCMERFWINSGNSGNIWIHFIIWSLIWLIVASCINCSYYCSATKRHNQRIPHQRATKPAAATSSSRPLDMCRKNCSGSNMAKHGFCFVVKDKVIDQKRPSVKDQWLRATVCSHAQAHLPNLARRNLSKFVFQREYIPYTVCLTFSHNN